MRLADFSALMLLDETLPRTKHNESIIFDFPEPFGPRMQLKLLPNNSSVLFANDLNPFITSLFILVIKSLFLVF